MNVLKKNMPLPSYGNKYNACQRKHLAHKDVLSHKTNSFKGVPSQSINFAILVDDTECNRYNKDGNTGPSYSCNKIGQNVTIRRWDTAVFSVCNIKVYVGECCTYFH